MEKQEQLVLMLKEYDLDNVNNMDESGVFFKMHPYCSYIKVKEAKSARGSKLMKAKDKVTLYVTTNKTGSDLLPLRTIGKSKRIMLQDSALAPHILCSK